MSAFKPSRYVMKNLLRIHRSSGMHWVGNGFPVRPVFDYNGLGRELSPFLLLDYAAPHPFAPGNEKRGVGAHPHKGFETVTVAYQGELEHRDSSGGGGKIGAGDVQWMTAGNGIVHEEFHSRDFTRAGDGITVEAKTGGSLLVMDGEPIDEPVVGQGPFVMNSRTEIQQAFEDYRLGRMGELG